MKSDAVIKPEESSEKRPTVLGMFASPEGNAQTKVSDNVFTIPEEISSPPTDEVFSPKSDEVSSPNRTEISSSNTDEVSPSTNPSEELPLLSVNVTAATAAKPESGSSIETPKTSSSSAEVQHGSELTPTTSQGGTSERIRGGTSEPDGVPKLRFCLPGKLGARGDGARLWGRRRKKKRPPSGKGKCESDIELTGTNSLSPLLPDATSQCSEMKETSEVWERSVSPEVHAEESDKTADNGCANDGISESGYSGHRPADFVSADQITAQRNTTGLEQTETNSTDCKPVNTIAEERKPEIVVNSPVEEESSLWDFDLSLDKPSDSNIEKDGCDEKDVTVADEEITDGTRPQNVASSPPSIWDIPSSENNISPEPGGSRFSVSRNRNDLENTTSSKPSSSRFTVSPS